MSEFMINNNPMQSDVSRNKVRESKLGIKRSNDLKKKVSETLTGKYPAWLNPRVQANPELTKRWLLLDKIYDLKERNVPNSDIAKSLKVFPHTTSMRSMLDYIVNNGDPRKNPQWVQFKKHHSGE